MHPDCFDLRNVLVGLEAQGTPPADELLMAALQHCAAGVAASRRRAADNLASLGGRFDISPHFPRALGVLRAAVCTRMPEQADNAHLVSLRDAAQVAVRESFQILAGAWPEMFAELQDSVTNLLFFDCPGLLGFSGLGYHGGIFLRVQDIEDPVKLAENILHEGSHVRLNTSMAGTQYFDGDADGRYASPLREDPRPMFGVFHQMFVLGRMLHFYDLVSARLAIHHRRHAVVRRQFHEAHTTVCAHARLTPAGQRLTDALVETTLGAAE